MSNRFYPSIFIATTLIFSGCSQIERKTMTAPPDYSVRISPEPLEVVVVTGGHPYDENAFDQMLDSIRGANITQFDLQDEAELFDDITNWKFDTIVLYNMTQTMTESRFQNFQKLLDQGVGLVPLHHGTLSWISHPGPKELYGVDFPIEGQPFGFHLNQDFWYEIDVADHPVTIGLSDFQINDETYTNFYGKGSPGNVVLVSSDHEPSDGPLVWYQELENTRVISLQGGHDAGAMLNEGFQELLARSIFWSAGEIEDYFLFQLDENTDSLEHYTFGVDRTPLKKIEMLTRISSDYPALEAKLSQEFRRVISTSSVDAEAGEKDNNEAKAFAFRQLERIAARENLPFVAGYLTDEKWSLWARRVFEATGGAYAEQELLAALPKTSGEVRLGIVDSLGRMRVKNAVQPLSEIYTRTIDERTQSAVARALGAIGTSESAKVLQKMKQMEYIELALLENARHLERESDLALASKLYSILYESESPVVRGGALIGLARLNPNSAMEHIEEHLKSDAELLGNEAVAAIKYLTSSEQTKQLTELGTQLSQRAQTKLLNALYMRDNPAVLRLAKATINSEDESLQTAALRAMGYSGDLEAAKILLQIADVENMDSPSMFSLSIMEAEGLDAFLVDVLEAPGDHEKIAPAAIYTASMRDLNGLIDYLIPLSTYTERKIRSAAIDVLPGVVKDDDLVRLFNILLEAERKSDKSKIANLIGTIAEQMGDSSVLSHYEATWSKADSDTRPFLLQLIGKMGSDAALSSILIKAEVDDSTRLEAIRVLGDWPDLAAYDPLMDFMESADSTREEKLALRSLLKVLQQPDETPAKTKLDMYINLEDRLEDQGDKALFLSGLGNIESIEAVEVIQKHLESEDSRLEAIQAIAQLAPKLAYEYPQIKASLDAIDNSELPESIAKQLVQSSQQVQSILDGIVGFWTFNDGAEGWEAANHCEFETEGGVLKVKTTGVDPFITHPLDIGTGDYKVELKIRLNGVDAPIVYYWHTDEIAIGNQGSFIGIPFQASDTSWNTFSNQIKVTGNMEFFRIDPGGGNKGAVDIDWIRITRM